MPGVPTAGERDRELLARPVVITLEFEIGVTRFPLCFVRPTGIKIRNRVKRDQKQNTK